MKVTTSVSYLIHELNKVLQINLTENTFSELFRHTNLHFDIINFFPLKYKNLICMSLIVYVFTFYTFKISKLKLNIYLVKLMCYLYL